MRVRHLVLATGGLAVLAAGHASLATPRTERAAPTSTPKALSAQMAGPVEQPRVDGRADLRRRVAAFVAADGRAGFAASAAEAPEPAVRREAESSGRQRPRGVSAAPPASAPILAARPFDRTVSSREMACLAEAIYYEARSESDDGQAAVAEVILNRAASPRYPADICEVVYQRNARTCQFSYTCDGSIGRFPVRRNAWVKAEHIAREVVEGRRGRNLPDRSVNYHADYVSPRWGARLERVRQIGAHIFYGSPLDGGATPGAEPARAPESRRPEGLEFRPIDALQRAYALASAERDG